MKSPGGQVCQWRLVRAWFSQPHVDVPPPFWMVAVPALDLAAALAVALARRR